MRHGLIFTTIVAVHGFIQIPTIGGHVAVQPATAKLNPIASNFGEAAFPATAPPLPPAPSQLTLLMREFTSTNKKELISLLFIALFATISATSVPLFFSRVLAALTAQNFSYKALLRPLSMMMLCHTIEPLMTIQYVKQSSSLVDKLVTALRTKTYLSILQSNVASLEAQGTTRSDVTQLVTAEMDRMKVTIMQNISRDRGIRAALELVMGLSILYSLCLPLALMFSTIIPITAFISSRFAIKMFDATRKEQAALLGLSARATETIQNLKEVYAFSNAPLELQRYNAIQLTTSKAALSTGTAKANFEASNRAGIYANIITMFGLGGIMVQKKFIAPTALVSFIGYCWSLNFATQGLLFSYGDFNVFSASYKRIAEFLGSASSDSSTFNSNPSMNGNVETSTDSKTSTAAQSTASSPMKIEFTGASFSYPTRPDVAVIRDVNLTMMPGSVTALVGPSGSGKSTLANLLCRLYEAKSGTVMIDGKDIVDIPVQSYLSRVSIVRQQPTLFTDSVFNNIAYGAVAYRNITMDDVIVAAKAANAHEFITKLPEGYNTVLGSGQGQVSLSGGQQQRVCIARAVLKNAQLLILDESTSALDSASEALVQESLQRLMKGRTTVVIAHRLSTVINADNICVVKDGRVVEQGGHSALMAKRGVYSQLMNTQMSSYTPPLPPPVLQSALDQDNI